jgi:O-antigen ligase
MGKQNPPTSPADFLSDKRINMLEKFILFFLFLLPFQFALSPRVAIDLPLGRVLVIVIFLWWFSRGLARRDIHLPPLIFTGCILSFLGITLLSLLWVENVDFALRKIFFLLNYFPLAFVFVDLGREKKNIVLWLKALCFGSFGIALLGISIFVSQFFFGVENVFSLLIKSLPFFLGSNLGQAVSAYPSLLVNIGGATILRATAFFPDPHVTSFYFGMSSFLALGRFFQEKKKLFLVIYATLVFADLLTFSRGGYLGLLVSSLSFILLSWRTFSPYIKKWLMYGLVILGALVILFGQPILSRFISSFTVSDSSSTERIALWQEAVENIRERPFLGTGIGNYILAIRPADEYRTPYYAHNLYLDVATELGFVGLFFFLLILSIPFFGVLQNYLKTRNIFLLSLFSALVLYLTHSLFETALFSVHILPLLLFVLALILTTTGKEPIKNSQQNINQLK